MKFRNSTIVSSFMLTLISLLCLPTWAALHVGDSATYDTETTLMIDGKITQEHSVVQDVVQSIAHDGTIEFEETRKTDSTTTTATVKYPEPNWLMTPDNGPQTGDEILSQCGNFPDSEKVRVSLKSEVVEGCDVQQEETSYTLHIVYAPVPLYIYSLEYHDTDEINHFDLVQQYVEP